MYVFSLRLPTKKVVALVAEDNARKVPDIPVGELMGERVSGLDSE